MSRATGVLTGGKAGASDLLVPYLSRFSLPFWVTLIFNLAMQVRARLI